jgi:hypothetical protein
MAMIWARCASVSLAQVAWFESVITSSFDFSIVSRKYARFFGPWQKLVQALAHRKQVRQQKASSRHGDHRWYLICPLQGNEAALAVGELDFDQRPILFPLMLYDGKGLPSQRMSGMSNPHDNGMCFYVCF